MEWSINILTGTHAKEYNARLYPFPWQSVFHMTGKYICKIRQKMNLVVWATGEAEKDHEFRDSFGNYLKVKSLRMELSYISVGKCFPTIYRALCSITSTPRPPILIIFKKKSSKSCNQFLHSYHHASFVVSTWLASKGRGSRTWGPLWRGFYCSALWSSNTCNSTESQGSEFSHFTQPDHKALWETVSHCRPRKKMKWEMRLVIS